MKDGMEDTLDIVKLLKESVIIEIRIRNGRFTGSEILKYIEMNNKDNNKEG